MSCSFLFPMRLPRNTTTKTTRSQIDCRRLSFFFSNNNKNKAIGRRKRMPALERQQRCHVHGLQSQAGAAYGLSLSAFFRATPREVSYERREKKEGRRKAADKVSPTCNVIWHMAPLRCLSSEYGRSLTFLFVYWILSAPAFLYAPVDLPRPIIMVRTAWTTLILVTSSYAHAVRHDDPATTTSSSSASSTPRSGLRSMP